MNELLVASSVSQRACLRTTSTEQFARAATAAETLPSKNLSTRLPKRFAPTKIESACQRVASSTRICFGFPAQICSVAVQPASFKICKADAASFSSHSLSLFISSSNQSVTGETKLPIAVCMSESVAAMSLKSLCSRQFLEAAASTVAFAPGEPS